MKVYRSTKKYGPEEGLSIAYRQWRAGSHCKLIHGYAIGFEFTFEAVDLDARNWVVDFGSLKPVKETLKSQFDHVMLVASDDPHKETILDLDRVHHIAKVIEFDHLGSEKIAEIVYAYVADWLKGESGYGDRIHLVQVQVWETPANSAIFLGEPAPWHNKD